MPKLSSEMNTLKCRTVSIKSIFRRYAFIKGGENNETRNIKTKVARAEILFTRTLRK